MTRTFRHFAEKMNVVAVGKCIVIAMFEVSLTTLETNGYKIDLFKKARAKMYPYRKNS